MTRRETIGQLFRRWSRGGRIRDRSRASGSSDAALRLPGFVCVGAQKAGTTTLHELLARHPQVFLPRDKELQYFTLHSDRPTAWYAGAFDRSRSDQRRGDITPYYLFHPFAAARIRALLPETKLIVLVRDPVERALSGYFHSVRLREESLPIDDAFASEGRRLAGAEVVLRRPGGRHRSHQMHSYVGRSRYEIQIRRYLEHFDPAQMLVVRSEDLFADPVAVWNRLVHFLELEPSRLPGRLPHANRGASEAHGVDASFRRRLREQLAPTYAAMEADHGIRW